MRQIYIKFTAASQPNGDLTLSFTLTQPPKTENRMILKHAYQLNNISIPEFVTTEYQGKSKST
jgi:23S rRNA A1618 N6-methylase RlmF